MSLRDALNGFMLGLRKGPVVSVSGMSNGMIAVTPVSSTVDVVNTLKSPTSSNVPSKWSRAFMGPGQPFAGNMNTLSQDAEKEPRTMQYIANVNATIAPRISWGLTAFSELRNAAENVPEVAGVITLITDEMKSFRPAIVDENDKEVDIPELKWMTEQPDRVNPWPVWLSRFIYNVEAYDAPAVYKMRNDDMIVYKSLHKVELVSEAPEDTELPASAMLRWVCDCGAPNFFPLSANIRKYMDGPVICDVCHAPAAREIMDQLTGERVTKSAGLPPVVGLRIIDGSTLFVLIDERGESPEPPAPAFTQVIWGTPRMFLNKNQVWYRPRYLRADAPYGRCFIENSMASVRLLANLWGYEGAKYQSGNLPEMGMECPPTWTDAEQILDYEEAYNARMAGSPEERGGRMRFFPNGMKAIVTKDLVFNKDAYDVAVNTIRMSAGIPKGEAGEAPGGMLGGSGFAEAMQSSFYRMCLAPMKAFIEGLFNDILRENGYTDLAFKLKFPNDSVDPEKEETKWATRYQLGGVTRDEYRQGLGLQPFGGERGQFIVDPGGQGQQQDDQEAAGAFGGQKPGGIGVLKKPIGVIKKPLGVLKQPVSVIKNPISVKKAVMSQLDALRPDWANPAEFTAGMSVETEHAGVVGGDLAAIAEMVLTHLKETPDYYTRLEHMEAEAAEALADQSLDLDKRSPEHDGVMVAFPIPQAFGALTGIEWPAGSEVLAQDDLHVTLAYLGELQHLDVGAERLFDIVRQYAEDCSPFEGSLNGIGRFTETHKDGKECVWLNFDAAPLSNFREALVRYLSQNEFPTQSDHGFTPHVTLAYYDQNQAPDLASAVVDSTPFVVDHIRVAWGDEVRDFPLGSAVAKALGMFSVDLQKHCGVCAADDQFYGGAVKRHLDIPTLPKGANQHAIVSIGGPGFEERPAIWKPEGGAKQGLAEWAGGPLHLRAEAAYLLDRELAPDKDSYLVPVTYSTAVEGYPGSIQHYVKGATTKRSVTEYAQCFVEQAAVLDYVMGQMDRVKKNYLTHPNDDTRPVLIDNDISFKPAGKQVRSDFVTEVQGRPLSEVTHEALYLALGNQALWDDLLECLQDAAAVDLAKGRAQEVYDAGMIPPAQGEELAKMDWEEDKHPRAKDGKFGSGGGFMDHSPHDRVVQFSGGVKGKNENKLIAYQHIRKPGEKYSEHEGGLIGSKISDHDRAKTCATCGRKVVHAYYVQDKAGDIQVYGSEHLHEALGYDKPLTDTQTEKFVNELHAQQEKKVSRARILLDRAKENKSDANSAFNQANPGLSEARRLDTAFMYHEDGKIVRVDKTNKDDVDILSENGFSFDKPAAKMHKAQWEEDEHPRAEDGKFGSGGGGTAGQTKLHAVLETAAKHLSTLDHEESLTFGADGSPIDWREESYEKGFMDVPPEMLAKMKDGYSIHNHPEFGGSFSPYDIALACEADLAEIRVIGKSYIYSMKRPKDGWNKSVWDSKIEPVFMKASSEVFNDLIKKVTFRKITGEEALEMHYHFVWEAISKKLGLEYLRTKR